MALNRGRQHQFQALKASNLTDVFHNRTRRQATEEATAKAAKTTPSPKSILETAKNNLLWPPMSNAAIQTDSERLQSSLLLGNNSNLTSQLEFAQARNHSTPAPTTTMSYYNHQSLAQLNDQLRQDNILPSLESQHLNQATPSLQLGLSEWLLVFLLISIIIISIVGNCLVCIAIFTDRRLRKLGNAFIVSLAVADLFVSCLVMTFALCNDLMDYWMFGERFCDIWISFDVMCCTASILNLCAISLDRFIHIKDCLLYNQYMTRRMAVSALMLIWIISGLVSFVPILLGWHKPPDSTNSNYTEATRLARHQRHLRPEELNLAEMALNDLGLRNENQELKFAQQLQQQNELHDSSLASGLRSDIGREKDRGRLRAEWQGSSLALSLLSNESASQVACQSTACRREARGNARSDHDNFLLHDASSNAASNHSTSSLSARLEQQAYLTNNNSSQKYQNQDDHNGAEQQQQQQQQSQARTIKQIECEQQGWRRQRHNHNVITKNSSTKRTKLGAEEALGAQLDYSYAHDNSNFVELANNRSANTRHSLDFVSTTFQTLGFSSFNSSSALSSAALKVDEKRPRQTRSANGPTVSSPYDDRAVESTGRETIKAQSLSASSQSLSSHKVENSGRRYEDEEKLQQPEQQQQQQQTNGDEQQKLPQCVLTLTPTYAVVSSVISFFIPCIIMLGLYSKLFACANRHVRNIRAISRVLPPLQQLPQTTQPKTEPCPEAPLVAETATDSAAADQTKRATCESSSQASGRTVNNEDSRPSIGTETNRPNESEQQGHLLGQLAVSSFDASNANDLEPSTTGQTQIIHDTSNSQQTGVSVTFASLPDQPQRNQSSQAECQLQAANNLNPNGSHAPQQKCAQPKGRLGLMNPARTWIKFGLGRPQSDFNNTKSRQQQQQQQVQMADSSKHQSVARKAPEAEAEREPFLIEQPLTTATAYIERSKVSDCEQRCTSLSFKSNTGNSLSTPSIRDKSRSNKASSSSSVKSTSIRLNLVAAVSGGLSPGGPGWRLTKKLKGTSAQSVAQLDDDKTCSQPYISPQQQQQQHQQYQQSKQTTSQLATHKAAITLGIIMGTFLFCWMPFFFLNILKAYCVDCIPSSLFRLFTWLGYANSALNPIIYGIHNSEFRNAFNRIFFKHLTLKNGRQYLSRRFSYDLRNHHHLNRDHHHQQQQQQQQEQHHCHHQTQQPLHQQPNHYMLR